MPDEQLPKYRFMPWARRGLVAHTQQADGGGVLPARAPLPVALTVSNAAVPAVNLSLYGPGDVSGIDPRVIVRMDPRAHATDAEPNYLAAIEFDLPDLPWMFTPARADANNRLRPWCVLIVLEQGKVDAPKVHRGAPLPTVRIPAEFAGTELPDLAESWAWAHVQALSDSADPTKLAGELASAPHLSVSRLLCPRRLEPGKRYYACLVPAFDLGVQRGLGTTPASTTALPAWDVRQAREVVLPVYYHWQFGTGPGGDFEALARRLTPIEAPAELGFQSMYIGEPRGGLANVDPKLPAAYTRMEGVLRAPQASNTALADIPPALQTGLQKAVNAPAELVVGNQPGTAVAPPLYGEWHLHRHRLDNASPAWLLELNVDPRMRAAAGLGAEVVRHNQEEFMQACWEQVGDVIKANALLNRARFAQEALQCMYERHYMRMPAARLLQVSAPVHARTRLGACTVRGSIARVSLPDGGVDVALRRMLSPQRSLLKRTAWRAKLGTPGSRSARLNLIGNLSAGKLAVDPTQFMPDGLTGTSLLDKVPATIDLDLSSIGIRAKLPALANQLLQGMRTSLRAAPQLPQLQARQDLAVQGVALAPLEMTQVQAHKVHAIVPFQGRFDPGMFGGLGGWTGIMPARITQDMAVTRYQAAFTAMTAAVRTSVAEPQAKFVAFDAVSSRNALMTRINPRTMVPQRVRGMLSGAGDVALESLPGIKVSPQQDRVMAAPDLDAPMYTYLAQLDSQRFLPGVGLLPADSITLVETNPRFIEAFMVGLNCEMNRELLWRGYPTDQRGTVMRQFWRWSDGNPDLNTAIHQWTGGALGSHVRGAGPGGHIVLLLRGQLLRRYPNTILYAWRAGPDGKPSNNPPEIREPVFRGQFDPDVSFAGFDLRDTDLTTGNGWYFVLQEQPTEPRFGFDEPQTPSNAPLTNWSDATWQHTGVQPGGHLVLAACPLTGKPLGGVQFGKNAAHLARITLQKPTRVAIKGTRMVDR